ncbi:MAG TPA: helix-turn-helix domain-containing protein [Solirubrobacterales bacterium]|jgi:hypothetical protein|nr:helix-turn-helix domain-containing protein [Solirubrobacterales bacterium]
MPEGDERQFDWESLVSRVIHPLKVAIIETLVWIDKPLSASDLKKIFGGEFSLSLTSYHLNELVKIGALEKVGHRRVRGAQEKFYFFALTPDVPSSE